MIATLTQSALRADENDQALPTVNILPCVSVCANSTPAKRMGSPLTFYPDKAAYEYVEAFVRVRYIVGADGNVRDVALLNLIGPQVFADIVERRIKDLTFQPATLNGQPVEQSLLMQYIFRVPFYTPGARGEIVTAYSEASVLLKAGKMPEAEAKLTAALALPRLNFYERGMLAVLMATIAEERKDFLEIRDLVTVPTQFYSQELPPAALKILLRFRIEAALNTGDMAEALQALAQLKSQKPFDPNDPFVNLVEQKRTEFNAQETIAVMGKIPDAGNGDEFSMTLYRRHFGFKVLSGTLDKFDVSCRQQTIESKITDVAEWHIPTDWDQCRLFVHGSPGATFQVLEATQ